MNSELNSACSLNHIACRKFALYTPFEEMKTMSKFGSSPPEYPEEFPETRRNLEAELLKGLESPLSPMTADDWADLKQQILQPRAEANDS